MRFNTILVGFLFILISESNAGFGDALRKLKEKAKNAYQKKFGKDKTWHFLGHGVGEYPGNNEKYRQMNREKWEEYYKCLNDQNAALGSEMFMTPEAVLGFEGASIKLECKVCLSPPERETIDSVEWQFAANEKTYLEPIEITENTVISPEEKTLHLYNLQIDQSGQYICKLGKSLTSPYFLTVVNTSDAEMREVHHPSAPLGPYPKEQDHIDPYGLYIDTEWSDWSSCSKCGSVGRRYKTGYCTVFSQDYNKTPRKNVNTNKTMAKSTSSNVTPLDLEYFKIFKYGIPCVSHLLPKSIRELPQIKDRKNEIMSGYCKIACPEEHVFALKDKNGKLIEEANNSAGIYSLQQGLPPLEPPVERRLQYGIKGKEAIVACPGTINTDSAVQWQLGDKNLVPEIISRESKGRIYISITDKIHIKDSKVADSNVYSCWQKNELAGTVRLVIEKKLELNFNHHIMLFGIVIILTVFLYVFLKAFAGRKYARTTYVDPSKIRLIK